MFKRRKKLPFFSRLSGYFWPRTGWKRSGKYMAYRIVRLPGTPWGIAAGFACGAAISFTPFLGLHFLFSALWAKMMRSSWVAALIGTWVGNPWTFPLIWIWIYKCGLWMGAGEHLNHGEPIAFADSFERIMDSLWAGNWQILSDTAWPILWPMIVGGIPNMILAWFLFYFPIRYMIEKYQTQRVRRRAEPKNSFPAIPK